MAARKRTKTASASPVEEVPATEAAFSIIDIGASAGELEDKEQSGLEKVVLIQRAQTGHDFSHYKKSTIYRRIERRSAQLTADKGCL